MLAQLLKKNNDNPKEEDGHRDIYYYNDCNLKLPSINLAPTSSKSLRASNFRSEPTEIHLNMIIKVGLQIKMHELLTSRSKRELCYHSGYQTRKNKMVI